MMSTETVAAKMGAGKYAKPIEDACIRFGIVTTLQKCHFLAQIETESNGFTKVRESMNYAADALISQFGRHRISIEDAKKYGRIDAEVRKRTGWTLPDKPAAQKQLADILYGGAFGRKELGNTQPGDGSRFIGRSLKQLTGRGNARAYSFAMYGDNRIEQHPEWLEELPDAALAAGWFWQSNNINSLADRDDLNAVTRRVNGGLNGVERRRAALLTAKKLFGEMTNG